MKVIIIAAGTGSRLSPFTDGLPKCMLQFGGKNSFNASLKFLKHLPLLLDLTNPNPGTGWENQERILYPMERR